MGNFSQNIILQTHRNKIEDSSQIQVVVELLRRTWMMRTLHLEVTTHLLPPEEDHVQVPQLEDPGHHRADLSGNTIFNEKLVFYRQK